MGATVYWVSKTVFLAGGQREKHKKIARDWLYISIMLIKYIFSILLLLASMSSSASLNVGVAMYDITGPAADINMMGYGKLCL